MRAMNRARTTTALLAATVLLAGCGGPSYDESAADCITAVNALPKDAQAKPRPKVCEPLEDKDYNLIHMSKIAHDIGMIDENGNPNLTGTPAP